MTSPTPMLVVCALDAGCYTRDGTLQPKGTAFDRVVTNPDGSDYAPLPGLALIKDDGRPLYVQNSGQRPAPPASKPIPTYANDADARDHGEPDNIWYKLSGSGLATQLQAVKP